KGVKVQAVNCGSAADVESAFANVAESRAGALAVAADAFFNTRHREIVALATRHKIPAIYEWREFVDAGGLASYGPNLLAIDRLAGVVTATGSPGTGRWASVLTCPISPIVAIASRRRSSSTRSGCTCASP